MEKTKEQLESEQLERDYEILEIFFGEFCAAPQAKHEKLMEKLAKRGVTEEDLNQFEFEINK